MGLHSELFARDGLKENLLPLLLVNIEDIRKNINVISTGSVLNKLMICTVPFIQKICK